MFRRRYRRAIATAKRRDGRTLVGVGDQDLDGLDGGVASIRHGNRHGVEIVGREIGRGFVIRRRHKPQDTGCAIDREERGILAADDAVPERIAVDIAPDHGRNRGAILRKRQRRARPAPVGDNDRILVDVGDCNGDQLVVQVDAVVRSDLDFVKIVAVGAAGRFEIRRRGEAEQAGVRIDPEQRSVLATDDRIADAGARPARLGNHVGHDDLALADGKASLVPAAPGGDGHRLHGNEDLRLDLVIVGAGSVEVGPADHEPAARERDDARVVLVAERLRVGAHRLAHGERIGVERLHENAPARAVAERTGVGGPGDGEAAVSEAHDLGAGRCNNGETVRNGDLRADRLPSRIEDLDVVGATRRASFVPRHGDIAVG